MSTDTTATPQAIRLDRLQKTTARPGPVYKNPEAKALPFVVLVIHQATADDPREGFSRTFRTEAEAVAYCQAARDAHNAPSFGLEVSYKENWFEGQEEQDGEE